MANQDLQIRLLFRDAENFVRPLERGLSDAMRMRSEMSKALQESMASIRKMQSQSQTINNLQAMRAEARRTTDNLAQLRAQQDSISRSGNPALLRQLPRLQAQIRETEAAEARLNSRTTELEHSLRTAGINTSRLEQEQRRLSINIEQAENRLNRQGGALQQAQVRMQRYQNHVARLRDLERQLAQSNQMQRKLQEDSRGLLDAQHRHDALASRVVSGAAAQVRHTQAVERSSARLQQQRERIQQQEQALDRLQRELREAGVDSSNFGRAQAVLERRLRGVSNGAARQARELTRLAEAERRAQRAAEEHARAREAARRRMQERLQMQQDVAGVAYPALAAGSTILHAAAQPVMQSATHADQVRQIAITGNMQVDEEKKLSTDLRKVALNTNQTQEEINKGVQILVANGMGAQDAANYAELLGDTATATRAQMEDISNVTFTLQNNLKIQGKDEMSKAMNNLVHAGKQGQFELKEMARYFPSMAANMASMGATGQEAVKEIGIAMQAARKASGTSGEAAANMANWFSHMTANSTQEHFASAGINMQAEMLKRMQNTDPSKRMSAFRASLDIFDTYLDKITAGKTVTIKTKKGKVKEKLNFRDALQQATADGNEAEVKSIVERFGLSEIIQDMQTANFYLAMRQNKDFIDKGMKSFDDPNVQNTIAQDKAKQLELATEQFKAMKIAAEDAGRSIGDNIMPALQQAMAVVTPWLDKMNQWIQTNPELTQTLLKIAGGIGVFMVAFGGLAIAIIGVLGPLTMMSYALGMLGGALGVLVSPFALIIAAVAGLGYAAFKLYQNWDKVLAWWNNTTWKQKLFDINQMGLEAVDWVKGKWSEFITWFAGTELGKKAIALSTDALDWARTKWAEFTTWWDALTIKDIGYAVGAGFRAAYDTAKGLWEDFIKWWDSISLKSIIPDMPDMPTWEGTKSTVTGWGDSIANSASSLWKGATEFGSGVAAGWNGETDGARASGGPVMSGGIYRVNELGPELLTVGGKSYLMATQSGMVTPLSTMHQAANDPDFGVDTSAPEAHKSTFLVLDRLKREWDDVKTELTDTEWANKLLSALNKVTDQLRGLGTVANQAISNFSRVSAPVSAALASHTSGATVPASTAAAFSPVMPQAIRQPIQQNMALPSIIQQLRVKDSNGKTKTLSEMGVGSFAELSAKGGQAFEGGINDPATLYATALVQQGLGKHFNRLTAQNDRYHHQNAPKSSHTKGNKTDFTVSGISYAEAHKRTAGILAQYGLKEGTDFNIISKRHGTGDHIDFRLNDNGKSKLQTVMQPNAPKGNTSQVFGNVIPLQSANSAQSGSKHWDKAKKFIVKAASDAGVDAGVLANIAHFESGFNDAARPIARQASKNTVKQFDGAMAISSGYGYGQLLDGTWRDSLNKYGHKYGVKGAGTLTNSQANQYRTDKALQAAMLAEITKVNIDKGKQLGGSDDLANIYALHNLGDSGGAKFLKALKINPNLSINQVLSQKVIKGNPALYGNGRMSLAQAYAKMGGYMRHGEVYAQEAQTLQGSRLQAANDSYYSKVPQSLTVAGNAALNMSPVQSVAPVKAFKASSAPAPKSYVTNLGGVTINVHPSPGMSEEHLAGLVEARLRDLKRADRDTSGVLYDND